MLPIIALATALLLPTPAHYHTATELEEWLTGWEERFAASEWELTVELAAEYTDMVERHPCYFSNICPQARPRTQHDSTFRGMGTNVERWRGLVTFWFGDLGPGAVEIALCLMGAESGGNPNAYNPSGASGLMQVLSGWADDFGYQKADLFNPDVNLRIARILYDDGGWRHWSPWNRGACH